MHVLRSSRQFQQVYRHGKRLVSRNFILFYLRHDGTGELRFGVVASKKIGKAARRNRAKRLLREAARSVAGEMSRHDLWIVLIARAQILEAKSTAVADELRGLLRNEGFLGDR